MKERGKKNHRILRRFILLFLGVFVPAFVVAFIVLIFGFVLLIADTNATELEAMGKYGRDVMISYESLPWLVPYWEEHAEEMDLPVFGLKDPDSAWYKEHKWVSESSPAKKSIEEINALPPESQKQFAEFCYEQIAEQFDYQEQTYPKLNFFCVDPKENQEVILLFRGMNSDVALTSYPLGRKAPLIDALQAAIDEPEVYPVLHSFVWDPRDKQSYQVKYAPVEADGRTLCYIEVSLMWDELIQTAVMDIVRDTVHVMSVVFAFGFFLLLVFQGFWIIRRIRQVQRAMERYDENKDSTEVAERLRSRVRVKRKDELDDLASTFVTLTQDIDGYLSKIEAEAIEREHTKAELSMAASIQEGQLPSTFPPYPDRNEFSLFASMDPAKEVGGDFYDFFFLNPDHLALVIADVSDKGVPAALFMMTAKTLLKSTLRGVSSLGEAMEHVNRQLYEANTAEMFVTVWVGILTISTGELASVNAGHEKSVVYRAGRGWEIERVPHDMALAMLDDLTFTEQKTKLQPGDALFVYTDGVVESTSKEQELFGSERMLSALQETADATPEEIILHMKEAIHGFVKEAEQFDDTTMLCLRYFGERTGVNGETKGRGAEGGANHDQL